MVPMLLCGQKLSWQNYTTNQGLPSNEVYQVIQDSRGFLWFATDQGICRYNGYDFHLPIDTSVYRGGSAFIPTEDTEGNIWFARLDASLWIIKNDTVNAWKYNAIIDTYKGDFMLVEQLAIAEDGTVWMALRGLGFLIVDPQGNHRLISELNEEGIVFSWVGNKVIYTYQSSKRDSEESGPTQETKEVIKIFHWENGQSIHINEISRKANGNFLVWGGWRLRNGDYFYALGNLYFLVKNNQIVWQARKNIEASKMVETAEGKILLAAQSGENRGLLQYRSIEHLRREEFTNLLPGQFVTNVVVDQQGGYWATTHNAGIFYCKNPDLDIFDKTSGLPSEDVVRLTHDGDQTIFAGLRPAHICAIHTKDGSLRSLPKPPVTSYEIWALHFDASRDRLWCSNPLYYLDNNRWRDTPFLDGSLKQHVLISAKKIAPDPSGNILLMSATFGFFSVDLEANTAHWHREKKMIQDRTFAVEVDRKGNIWVATIKGLRLWNNGKYELLPFNHPALRFPVSDLKMLPDDGMVISLRGGGLLLRDSSGRFSHLTRENGLTSDYLPNLYVSPQGIILACSNTGLNRISRKEGGAWKVEAITIKQGLPSNQVNDAILIDEALWVATNQGLVHFRKSLPSEPMPAPILEKIFVNNRDTGIVEGLRLKHNQNYLSIHFFALHFRSGGKISYRYRLLGADTTFKYIRNRLVNFAKLQPGDYTFEVQAQNENGEWGEPTKWNFTIQPAWWQTRWFAMFVALVLLGGTGLFYIYRLGNIKRENQIQEKIRQLETAALRAQMNPHFIFNCLSSIQQFIIENDPAEATRYLTRFARLVRLTLHSSVDGQHNLREEMDMLENYLALEQLRFRGKFNYALKTDSELDPESVFLPPMLVQPFVENALLHGMKNKTGGGKVEVDFKKQDQRLMVTITDNGPGIDTMKGHNTSSGHKSVGMTLTQNRLEILAGKKASRPFQKEHILNSEGEILGSRIILFIPIA